MRRVLLMLFVLTALFIAACGGDDDSSESEADAGTNGDTASEVSDGDFEMPSDEEIERAMALLQGDATFSVTVTGADEWTVTQDEGFVVYSVLDFSDTDINLPTRNELTFTEGSFGEEVRQLLISIPPGTEAGIYDFGNTLTDLLDETAFLASYFVDSPDVSESYEQNIEGSLTLDSVDGDTISGSFDFTAQIIDFSDTGEEITQTITVAGEFADVTLQPTE